MVTKYKMLNTLLIIKDVEIKTSMKQSKPIRMTLSIKIKVTHVDDMGILGHFYKGKCEMIQLLLKPIAPLSLQDYLRVYTRNKRRPQT